MVRLHVIGHNCGVPVSAIERGEGVNEALQIPAPEGIGDIISQTTRDKECELDTE